MNATRSTWILVANRAGARLFDYRRGQKRPYDLIKDIAHPEGRLHDRDINADRSGRSFPRKGSGSSSLDKRNDSVALSLERFAIELAGILEEDALANAFSRLIIVAEPKFLGRLLEKLRKATAARIAVTIPKDIAHHDLGELGAELDLMLSDGGRHGRDLYR